MESTYELNSIFSSYREYVGMCVETGDEVPTLSEFTGSDESLKLTPETITEEPKQ